MRSHSYHQEVSKPWRLLIGSLLGLFGLLGVSVAVLFAWVVFQGDDEPAVGLALTILFLFLGGPACLYSFRLLTGRARSDGGIISPHVLRIAGVLLFLHPLISVAMKDWNGLILSFFFAGAGGACFALASYRERRSSPSSSGSTFEPR